MFKLDEFSNTLLELHALARQADTVDFQHRALELIRKILPFDSAWWGIMSPHEDSFLLHSSHLYELPTGYVSVWERTKVDDRVARGVCDQPKRTLYFDERKLKSAPGLAALTGEHGIHQAFCTSVYLPSESAFIFLSLYREKNRPRFTSDETLLNQYLMPHLCSSWTVNREYQIDQVKRGSRNVASAMALLDRHHEILNVEPAFHGLLQSEWPGVPGLALPEAVRHWLTSGDDVLKLREIVLRRHSLGEFRLIEVRPKTRVDTLSPREAEIAEAFGRGLSYKQIARELDSAPATIRHHLRVIYEKLGVSDKAAMTALLSDSPGHLERDEVVSRQRKLQSTL